YLSKLLVTGTPAELKTLPAVNQPDTRRVEIETQEAPRLLRWLQLQSFSRGATIFGTAVHALVESRIDDYELIERLRRESFESPRVRPIAPSLEDVFVTLTQQAAAEREGGPAVSLQPTPSPVGA